MNLFADTTSDDPGGLQLALGCVLAAVATYWLLPRARGRSVALGTFAAIASIVVLARWVLERFGEVSENTIERILFGFFAISAIVFSLIFVTQKNPARGAIAFAFTIMSTCGLFLLLAAPFLFAATIIIYAGAIIVTFLFVLMLSHTEGVSSENDRSREPMLGSLGGFAFLGMILLTMYMSGPSAASRSLPLRPVTPEQRAVLYKAAERINKAVAGKAEDIKAIADLRFPIADIVGGTAARSQAPGGGGRPRNSIQDRIDPLIDAHSMDIKAEAERVRKLANAIFATIENKIVSKPKPDPNDIGKIQSQLHDLRDHLLILAGYGELPARNVANMGFAIYTDHLLAVEMAGTILLVATIGAVLIAGRKGASA